MTPPPHLNLTMSSLGGESYHQPQNTQKSKSKSNKTHIYTS